MSTPNEMIQSGLAKRQKPVPTRPARATRFAPMDSSDTDLAPPRVLIELPDLHKMAVEASAVHAHFSEFILGQGNITSAKVQKLLDAATREGISRTVTDAWAENAAAELRRADAYATEETRMTSYSKLRDLRAKVDSTTSFYESPVMLVSRHALGSEERGRMVAQVASAGPATLTNYAGLAASQGPKGLMLAVAILDRLDTMSKEQRDAVGFSRQSLAAAVAGQAHARATWAISTVKNREANAALLNRVFVSQSPDFARVKIEHALHVEREAGILRAAGIVIEE